MNLKNAHRDDRSFIEDRLFVVPDAFKKDVLKDYFKKLKTTSRREANLWLIDTTDRVEAVNNRRSNKFNINATVEDLKTYAKLQVDGCKRTLSFYKDKPLKDIYDEIAQRVLDNGLESSFIKEEPTQPEMQSLIKRSLNPSWWMRHLRQRQELDIERIGREYNLVNNNRQRYVTDENLKRGQRREKEQKQWLDNMLAENEEGEIFTLGELKSTSVSNLVNRRAELMVRIRGFEDASKKLGHVGLFITMTCPSKYHRAFGISGDENPNYAGYDVKAGQAYLQTVWSRIRASLAREDIRCYGFRVAEPHHDGTPHWHMLLFLSKDHIDTFKNTLMFYCLEEDGIEKGALENRVKFIDIDPKKGSATGYIAKYIAKNINGEDLDVGLYGDDPLIAAKRVTVWASVWGIRQFQQLGGAPVTVWREVRRLKKEYKDNKTLEAVRLAADKSDWEGYQNAMGGINIPRADRPVSVVYKPDIDVTTGEIKMNQYGEMRAAGIFGIKSQGETIKTRTHDWRVFPAN
ncbi:replication endonuclease [Methylophaga thalassica]|uniref:replication endonuclease n=1 Tax=Methylophaga aminisulfidivorans TaxID=230105 RepID=UPI003A8DC9CF